MKKLLLTVIAAIMAISAFAQGTVKKIRVYNDNEIVFEYKYRNVDSVVFVDVPNLSGVFSVSDTKKVNFSSGNLQATTTDLGETWTWGFALNQWDYIGGTESATAEDATTNNKIIDNGKMSANGTIDLFGWSTTATTYGIYNKTNQSYYKGDFVDWGNAVGDGWHTLSIAEWKYLFCDRPDAAHLFGMGSVNGVNGIILLPDDWAEEKFDDTDNGLTDKGIYLYKNEAKTNFSFHTITANQWYLMEEAGAVFLPAAGHRYGVGVGGCEVYAKYWASDGRTDQNANMLYGDEEVLNPEAENYLMWGNSVRLVREVK